MEAKWNIHNLEGSALFKYLFITLFVVVLYCSTGNGLTMTQNYIHE